MTRHNGRRARRGTYALAAIALLALACSDPTTSAPATGPHEEPEQGQEREDEREKEQEPPPRGLIVSEPQRVPPAPAGLGAAASSPSARVAYVSAEPGTFPGAESVRVRNATAGGPPAAAVPIVDGGFDPVGVPADSGDVLELAIYQADGETTHVRVSVPSRRPPRIVRTSPTKGRTDVALSVVPVVVFSEPIDPASLSPTSVQLLRDGAPVSGAAALLPGQPFTVQFVPAAALEPSTEYVLAVSADIRDLDGEALGEELRVAFRTAEGEPATVVISNVTTGGALDVDGYRVKLVGFGSKTRYREMELNTEIIVTGPLPDEPFEETVHVELEDVAENCEVIGPTSHEVALRAGAEARVQFEVTCTPLPGLSALRLIVARMEPSDGPGYVSGLYTMNADGSGLERFGEGGFAVVSPDGSRIAFTRGLGPEDIYVMNADGTGLTKLGKGHHPRWSPDGTRIAFWGFDESTYWLEGPIEVVNADGSGRKALASGAAIGAPAWSPDGSLIAFLRDPQGPVREEVWVVDPESANARRIGAPPPWPNGSYVVGNTVAWTPDGSRMLLLESAFLPRLWSLARLWSLSLDGTAELLLEREVGLDIFRMGIAWSPDRRWIALTRILSGEPYRHDTYLLDTEDGSLIRITADGVTRARAFLP